MKNIKIGMLVALLTASLNITAQERKLSLEEALSIARGNNRSLQSKSLDVQNAREEIRMAKSNMLPSVNVGAGYSYYFDRQVIFMPGAFAGNDSEPVVDVAVGGKNAFNTSLTFSQPLVSEATRRQIKSAKITEAIEETMVKDHKGNLTVRVTTVYYQALLIQESIQLNKQSLARNVRALNDSKSLFYQGKSLKVDTLKNYILVENLQTTISHLENQHRIALLQLKQLLGTNEEQRFVLTDSLSHNTEQRYFVAVEMQYQDAVWNRPDVQIKKMHVELAQSNLSRTKAERLPSLSLVGAYQLQAQADDRRFNNYPRTSFVGLQANIPLFNGGRTNARTRQAKVQFEKQEIELRDATERASTEVETFENNLKELVQRVETHRKTVQAAEVNYRIINDRYKNGLSSRLELTDAELTLTEAKLNELQTVFHTKVAKLQLDNALGLLQY